MIGQHAQVVAVVEHGRHVVGEIEIGAVGIAGDHRDGVLVELARSARRDGRPAAPGQAGAWRPGRAGRGELHGGFAGCWARPPAGNASSAASGARRDAGSNCTLPLPRNRTMNNPVSVGRAARPPRALLLRTPQGYHMRRPPATTARRRSGHEFVVEPAQPIAKPRGGPP